MGDRNPIEIQNWLIAYLSQELNLDKSEVDITVPFDRYGLDSATAVGMTSDLEDWLNCTLDPAIVYDYPTIQELARYLAEMT
jgi:acyl carrier protein